MARFLLAYMKASLQGALEYRFSFFGQVFANETPLRWVIVKDEFGRDPALEVPGTSIRIFPLTMISKRVEQGEAVDVAELYHATLKRVEELRKDADSR